MESLLSARNSVLLAEALARFNQIGYRLPHLLLPMALTQTSSDCRPAMALAVGEAWPLVGTVQPAVGMGGRDADRYLRRSTTRRRDDLGGGYAGSTRRGLDAACARLIPARAREWLADVWKREKVDARVAFLETFEVGLAAEDEESSTSRLAIGPNAYVKWRRRLLTSLPTSALAGRMRARAEAMLTLKSGAFDVRPPTAVDADWERDGLTEKVGQGRRGSAPPGWRRFWVRSAIALGGAFRHDARGADRRDRWLEVACERRRGMDRRGGRFREHTWAAPLWRCWLDLSPKEMKQAHADRSELCGIVAPMLAPTELEGFALEALTDPKKHDDFSLYEILDMLPRPWNAPVADAWIAGVLSFIGGITAQTKLAEPWDDTLETAALALPETHFVNKVEPLDIPDSKHWQINYFRTQLEEWQTTISLRRRIAKELPL